MNFARQDLSTDGFLDGQIEIIQPKQGFRSATDAVFLAAAVAARPDELVLELGCGAGVALACLCARINGLSCYGLEIQPEYSELARENLKNNAFNAEILTGDLNDMPEALKSLSFDHVIANPPFFAEHAHISPRNSGRAVANIGSKDVNERWIGAGLRRLKQGGVFTTIQRAESLADILIALQNKAGDIKVLPVASRHNKAAQRVIVQARKSACGPLRILPTFVVHDGEHHCPDIDDYSLKARQILRGGGALPLNV